MAITLDDELIIWNEDVIRKIRNHPDEGFRALLASTQEQITASDNELVDELAALSILFVRGIIRRDQHLIDMCRVSMIDIGMYRLMTEEDSHEDNPDAFVHHETGLKYVFDDEFVSIASQYELMMDKRKNNDAS